MKEQIDEIFTWCNLTSKPQRSAVDPPSQAAGVARTQVESNQVTLILRHSYWPHAPFPPSTSAVWQPWCLVRLRSHFEDGSLDTYSPDLSKERRPHLHPSYAQFHTFPYRKTIPFTAWYLNVIDSFNFIHFYRKGIYRRQSFFVRLYEVW